MHNPARPRYDRSAETGFAFNPLNRLSDKRDDDTFIAGLRGEAGARAVVIAGETPILKRAGEGLDALFSLAEAAGLGAPLDEAFLGMGETGPLFALALDLTQAHQARPDLAALDMRSIVIQGVLAPGIIGALGQAKSLFYWHSRHRFCGNCGGATQVSAAGWRRECAGCKAQHFPRTDPVVIMLAHEGGHCLMGRQKRFPPGMFSCLAGFIESGETIEDAVRREIFEEAGVATREVIYLNSQPWPFPASLMIGCLARASSRDLSIDHLELEEARWFSREECGLILQNRHPARLTCPPRMAIANHLLRAWAVDGLGA